MGKPGHRNGWSSARKGTRGTETSKYPEEKKSNEMPTVAASEEGRAQTCKLRLMGVDPEYHGARGILWEAGGTTLQG